MSTKGVFKLNLIGITKGKMTVISPAIPNIFGCRYLCRCECGGERIIQGTEFNKAKNKYITCVCHKQKTKEFREHPLYDVWKGMRARCNDKNHIAFKNYGGRGIIICKRWNNFHNFFADVSSGYLKGLALDRINNDGDYEPGNVQWITPKENSRKSRVAKLSLDIADEIRKSGKKTEELALKYNVCKATIWHIRRGTVWVR